MTPTTPEAPPTPGQRHVRALTAAILVLGIALRLVHLDADPDYYAWVGYVTDEGRWIAHARELILFGHLVNTEWLVHLMLAPLFQAASYVVFWGLGVGIWSSRLLTALSGSAILVLVWIGLRRRVTPAALLVALALLACEVDLLMLSRVAVPEVPAMALELGVFLLLATGRLTARRLLGAGLLLLAMVGVKATTVFLVPILSLVLLLQPRAALGLRRLPALLLFWAPGMAALALALAALVLGQGAGLAIGKNVELVRNFLGTNRLFTVLAFPFEADFGPVFNMWAMALCLVGAAWLGRGTVPAEASVRRVAGGAAVWTALYSAVMVSLAYFPDRYRVHVLIPMAVTLAAGLTLTAPVSLESIAATLRAGGFRAVSVALLLAVPIAALWAPVLAGLGRLAGVDPTRLRLKLLCLGATVVLATWLVRRLGATGAARLRALLVAPVVGVLLWLIGQRTGGLDPHFWPVAGTGLRAWWVTGPWVTALLTLLLVALGRGWRPGRWAALVPAAALAYGALVVARVAPSYVHPRYTIKETSEALGATLAPGPDLLVAARSEGLFTATRLPYRSALGRTWPAHRPERIVMVFRFDDPEDLLARDYTLVATYTLFLSPEYEDEHSPTLDVVHHQETVKVYVRRGGRDRALPTHPRSPPA